MGLLTSEDGRQFHSWKVLKFSEVSRTRSNGFKLTKFTFHREVGRNWYGNRVVDEWNKLPAEILQTNRVDTFKNKLDSHMDNQGWI